MRSPAGDRRAPRGSPTTPVGDLPSRRHSAEAVLLVPERAIWKAGHCPGTAPLLVGQSCAPRDIRTGRRAVWRSRRQRGRYRPPASRPHRRRDGAVSPRCPRAGRRDPLRSATTGSTSPPATFPAAAWESSHERAMSLRPPSPRSQPSRHTRYSSTTRMEEPPSPSKRRGVVRARRGARLLPRVSAPARRSGRAAVRRGVAGPTSACRSAIISDRPGADAKENPRSVRRTPEFAVLAHRPWAASPAGQGLSFPQSRRGLRTSW